MDPTRRTVLHGAAGAIGVAVFGGLPQKAASAGAPPPHTQIRRTIASVAFPGVYLRMDGSGVTSFLGNGGGTVNCQYGASDWEKFWFGEFPDGTVSIASVAFPGVYLRMDGSGITSFLGNGGGTVNCQYGASTWERFRLRRA